MGTIKIRHTDHFQTRAKERGIDPKEVNKWVRTSAEMMRKKEIRMTIGNMTIVAKRSKDCLMVITAWKK